MRRSACILLLLLAFLPAMAQPVLKGAVVEAAERRPIPGAAIVCVQTGAQSYTDSQGNFAVTVSKGQLYEFKRDGFKTERFRIPEGTLPPYMKVFLEVQVNELPDYIALSQRAPDWKTDSTRYARLYKHELEFARMSALDMINHPFSALSKRNQQIWAFQDEYEIYQRQKFVDYTFNAKMIGNITGLRGDSAARYMRMYRPSYELARGLKEYDFYLYIQRTAQQFRHGRSSSRGAQ